MVTNKMTFWLSFIQTAVRTETFLSSPCMRLAPSHITISTQAAVVDVSGSNDENNEKLHLQMKQGLGCSTE